MQATADSKIVKIMGIVIEGNPISIEIFIIEFPSKDISKWPAIRLAVKRTHNVIGRIIFLVNSMSTINIIRGIGVPCGNKCLNIWFVFFIQPNLTIQVQKIKDKGKVIVKWEVGENTWG